MVDSMGPRVAVLMGGPDEEYEISLQSGQAIADALRAQGVPAVGVVLGADRAWRFPGDEVKSVGRGLDHLRRDFDVAFLAFHGATGEGGRVQAALDLLGLPYAGSPMVASAAAMDKWIARSVFRQAGIPVGPALRVLPGEEGSSEDLSAQIIAQLGLPVVLKPPDTGSSFGVEIVRTEALLERRLGRARAEGASLLAEAWIEGPEYTVAILEYEDGPRALPIIKIVPRGDAPFFTREIKYDPSAVDEICPAPDPPERLARLEALGLAAHRALGCRDLSRTDIIWGEGGPMVLETNTIPGLTAASLYPKAAAAAGLSLGDLAVHLVRRAYSRRQMTGGGV